MMNLGARNLVLTGMPGAGKSTVGVLLAKTLMMSFTDTDLLIQRRSGMPLQEMINRDGVDAFLAAEADVAASLDLTHTVIATGGSVVCSPRAVTALKKNGYFVFLDVPVSELTRRLTDIRSRGIAMRRGESIGDLYLERLPLYRASADVTVPCDGREAEETVNRIVMLLDGIRTV